MKATCRDKKSQLNKSLGDMFSAMLHITPKNILPPEEFVRLPMSTMKYIYEKQMFIIFKWIGHDLEVLYKIVNDKEYEQFDGEKCFQTWLKLKENERSKKKKLSDFLKD